MLDRRAFMLGALTALFAGLRAYADEPPDLAIQTILQERVGKDRESTGIVAVLSDSTGSRLFTYGASSAADNRKLDGDTVFEIASITKLLTALILAAMVERGEVEMSDPVAKYLPPSVKVPAYEGQLITLLDLATYTSGLPIYPDNFTGPNYTVDEFYAFLSGYTLKYRPGIHYEYANVGFGLLGHALARRAGKSYEALLVERVCDPLGLRSTRIIPTADMRSRLAQGHDRYLVPTPPSDDIPTLAGAYAAKSTANDLTVLLEACLGRRQTPLEPAVRRLLETRRPTGLPGHEVGLGWFISSNGSDEIAWKSGLTRGFNALIAFSTRSRRGSIALSNAFPNLYNPAGPSHNTVPLAFYLINPDFRPNPIGALFRPR
jgi:D-alanyl-D-alanine-carboxypeptidase/D-alanyl-D-alanine-endopeptidase